jgi:MYXO-CTERM domain-containing protein
MMRWLALGLILVGDVALAAPGQKDIPYTKTPIAVTGELSQFPASAQLFALSADGTFNNTATFYAAWDDASLYFGVEVQDAALFCSPEPADSQNTWNNDAVELLFDLKSKKAITQGDQDFRQFIVPINFQNNLYDAYGTGTFGDTSFQSKASVNVKLNGTLNDASADTGYTVIVQIPWSDLATTPAYGVSFGFDGAVDDVDAAATNAVFRDWAGLQVFAQPDQWGSLRLTGKGGGPVVDGGPKPGRDGGPTTKYDWGGAPTPDKGRGGAGVDRPKEGCGCSLADAQPAATMLPLVAMCLIYLRTRRRR